LEVASLDTKADSLNQKPGHTQGMTDGVVMLMRWLLTRRFVDW